jgi:hypothetical protein
MTPNPTAEQPRVASPSDPGPPTLRKELSADEKQRFVAECRKLLAGEIERPLPPPPSEVEEMVAERAHHWEQIGHASEQARLRLLDELTLCHYYGGNHVATMKTKNGRTSVLAWGMAEIRALLEGVPEEERGQVLYQTPEPLF